ncbi:MAG: DUF4118 domain-containing protein [Betaproteobacteria bacterium]|nr:DUF4118 domain-containing protein [Betaproteobacteria bacterium]
MNIRFSSPWQQWRYPLATSLCILTTLALLPLREQLEVANIDMLFLLAVFVAAFWFGRGPAVWAAILGVALFDFCFVPPYLSLAVADAEYLITLAVMLAVGLVTAQLVATLADRTALAGTREREARQLYELARELGSTLQIEQVEEVLSRFHAPLGLKSTLFIPEAGRAGAPLRPCGTRPPSTLESSFATSAYERGAVVELDSLAGTGTATLFLPLSAAQSVRGVLACAPVTDDLQSVHRHRPLLQAAASVTAMTIERLHYAQVAQQVEAQIAAERLRVSILASLSHDLRTPLTSLVGLAETLTQDQTRQSEGSMDTAGMLRDQAHAMHRMLCNLLDMVRLQVGNQTLNRQWQPFEEVIGSSARLLTEALARNRLCIEVPKELPLVNFDAVLLERVMCNLLDNAAKYATVASTIRVSASAGDGVLEVLVDTEGPGFPSDRLARIFGSFVRGDDAAAVPGSGLGLAICKTIIEAHEGTIEASNRRDGARVRFTLPLGTPPAMPEDAPA